MSMRTGPEHSNGKHLSPGASVRGMEQENSNLPGVFTFSWEMIAVAEVI